MIRYEVQMSVNGSPVSLPCPSEDWALRIAKRVLSEGKVRSAIVVAIHENGRPTIVRGAK